VKGFSRKAAKHAKSRKSWNSLENSPKISQNGIWRQFTLGLALFEISDLKFEI
jgi:hypothetical protein